MTLLPAFDSAADRSPRAGKLPPKLRMLAEKGVHFGTASRKYDGWIASIYSRERYIRAEPVYYFVNNRPARFAPGTIEALVDEL